MKMFLVVILLMLFSACLADEAKFFAYVADGTTGKPVADATVKSWFEMKIGWRAWTESAPVITDEGITDEKGLCKQRGKTNTGEITCCAEKKGAYYKGVYFRKLESKNLFGVWQPDNLVATIRLQRVEHPVPLFVKRVELRDYERGIGGFDGTNSVLRFDLVKGDWLPPYGNGEVPDFGIRTEMKVTGKERKFRYATKKVEDVLFYDLDNHVKVDGNDNFIQTVDTDRMSGIKIRKVKDDAIANQITRVKGMRKQVSKNGNWHCEYFSDKDPDRCYTFRIRTRCNDKGELVEAYYGKIYGDFEFEGDDKKGLIGVKFLYYLNPKPLDRNLEWDMKTNLCPKPGEIGQPQP